MGQKIRPDVLRLGITQFWNVRWIPKRSFRAMLQEDEVIRAVIQEKISAAGVAKIEIERTASACRIFIKAARPGFIIGRGGQGIEQLSRAIEAALKKMQHKLKILPTHAAINLNVEELKRSEIAASNVAQNIAADLEKRLPCRRTMKKAIDLVMQHKEVGGVKIRFSGRLDGAEIARREWMAKGKLPLQTLRANIEYGEGTAFTVYGTVGIKVWIYKGEILN